MARSKTGSFWLTEQVELIADATVVQGTLDLGAYVDVGDQQAIAIEQVDFIWQRKNPTGFYSAEVEAVVSSNATGDCQLTDLNPDTLILSADDHTLIASGNIHVDQTNFIITHMTDFFPDIFGKLDESRMVVNDQLYITGLLNGTVSANETLAVTVRVKARIVKLSTKDWMAIAIQSTAADN